MKRQWREKLLLLSATDARVRKRLAESGELYDGYSPKMERVHLENAAELEGLIDENGGIWVGKRLVGDDGAEAAWLIVQHAVSLPDFSRRCLKLLEQAVAANEAEPYQYAYLYDRICFFENRPQKFGTQSDWNESGKMEIWKLENKEKVNVYRARFGLEPLENFTWENEETRENQPEDFAARRAEFESWARRVGWR